MNTKPFFGESEANFEAFQKVFNHTGDLKVCFKVFQKSKSNLLNNGYFSV